MEEITTKKEMDEMMEKYNRRFPKPNPPPKEITGELKKINMNVNIYGKHNKNRSLRKFTN